jgi:hypothetical protein
MRKIKLKKKKSLVSIRGLRRIRKLFRLLEAIQMSNRTRHGAELIPEVHYPIDLCDDVVSSSTGSTWDSGPASSLLELPQSSM